MEIPWNLYRYTTNQNLRRNNKENGIDVIQSIFEGNIENSFQCSLMKDINAQTQRSITHTKQNILYTDTLLHSYIIAEVKSQDPSEQLPTNNEVLRKEKSFGMLSLAKLETGSRGILPNKSTQCLPRQSSRDKSKKCSDKTLEISL